MFTLTQDKIEALMLAALKDELGSSLRNQWGTGQKLRNIVEKAVSDNAPAIEAAVNSAVLSFVRKPEFESVIAATIAAATKDKFTGAFDAVMRAAGKRAAQDALLTQTLADAMKAAALARIGGAP